MAGLSAENPLKDVFQLPVIRRWARRLAEREPTFPEAAFLERVAAGWNELGFGQRARRITDALEQFLPPDFPRAARLLIDCLDSPLGPEDLASLERFYVVSQTAWVARRATPGNFDAATRALYEMTRRFSAEGDLRVLFDLDEAQALTTLRQWVHDPDPHVRRLVSEGTRPRLPLAPRWRRFDSDPGPILGLLDALKDDPSLYVRRSVANNLNDGAKDHPDRVAGLLAAWSPGAPPGRRWVVEHAGRTLVKRGHPVALALTGVEVTVPWEVGALEVEPGSTVLGGTLRFAYRLVNRGSVTALAVADFSFAPWPGKVRPKVFKGRRVRARPDEAVVVAGHRSLANTSGRTWRPGPHRLVLLVNGEVRAEVPVTLREPD